jgi:hypothetical protein
MMTMFTEIRATNFKSWARLAPAGPADRSFRIERPGLPLGRVTGLFGANSSGKTSIFQVLLLLEQTDAATAASLALATSSSFGLITISGRSVAAVSS